MNALDDAVQLDDLAAKAAVFRALSTTRRLAVFAALVEELTVPQLRMRIGALAPERDLAVLRDAGLVERLPGVAPQRWRRVPGVESVVAGIIP
ncbi:hypothetical protein ATK17_3908 [Branchiibius hedensis]|uniref:Uncharacterized protein n=1 Tax=Branchiibius hedensis TaxID=672460 RepID=A0A2Y9BN03_9MICO|nr:hypothetical protein [Branchiibius hedensis]PWJ23017.1 hypothetical protein ATK17_3908 [Branchiibius hedensis]SSA59093.1 hypothetical protein SAMN04489750_3908 [Branchiibius hedensis]